MKHLEEMLAAEEGLSELADEVVEKKHYTTYCFDKPYPEAIALASDYWRNCDHAHPPEVYRLFTGLRVRIWKE